MSASYRVTTAELAAFETWFRVAAGMGALTFEWPDPRTGSVRFVRFAEDPYGIVPLEPGRWELRVSLEEWA